MLPQEKGLSVMWVFGSKLIRKHILKSLSIYMYGVQQVPGIGTAM